MVRLTVTSRLLTPVVVVIACAVSAVSAASAQARTPPTVARTAAVGAAPIRPDIAADFVSVRWKGPDAAGRIRFRHAGRWRPWRALPPGDAGRPGWVTSELTPARGAASFQVRLPEGARAGRVLAIRSAVPPSTQAARSPARLPSPAGPVCYYSRAAWGADESLRPPSATPAFFPVQVLTVHHTATANDDPDPAATVRAIYVQHVVGNGWDDIGYQLLIDERGCVYEGRASGDDGLPVFAGWPSPAAALAVNGAHVAGFNAGNVGVALLGDFSDRPPTPAARRALVGVLALLAAVSGVDPLARVGYVNPISGVTRDVDAISGHRDWLPTECPGAELYRQLPDVRDRVDGLMRLWLPRPGRATTGR